MTGVTLGLGLEVMELITVPDWGLGCRRGGVTGDLTLLTRVTWPGVTCWVERCVCKGGGGKGYPMGRVWPRVDATRVQGLE